MGITVSITLTIAILGGFVLFLFLSQRGKMGKNKNTNSKQKMNTLDSKIREKFKLFTGLRTQEEDQKMYDKIMELCFDEVTGLMSDKLSDEDKKQMLDELSKTQSDDDKQKVVIQYLSKISNYNKEVTSKLDFFLNKLYLNSLKQITN